MRRISWLTVLFVAFGVSVLHAADYAKIDRSLAKEPAYQSETPRYALLLFGREAPLRVWIVLDGETVYLDRDADGDLTDPDEHFENVEACKDIKIADPDGKTTFTITRIRMHEDKGPPRTYLMANVDINGPVSYRQYSSTYVDADSRKADIAHFHGPLTAGPITINYKVPENLALTIGEEPTDLRCLVGTMSDEHGCWVVVRSHNGDKYAFPEGVHPRVKIEFPRKNGGPPITKDYILDEFC